VTARTSTNLLHRPRRLVHVEVLVKTLACLAFMMSAIACSSAPSAQNDAGLPVSEENDSGQSVDASGDSAVVDVPIKHRGDAGPIDGGLTVHAGYYLNGYGTLPVVMSVFLGDGSRDSKPVDARGDVTFSGESLRGPQDVTLLGLLPEAVSLPPGTANVWSWTVLGFNAPEMFYGTYVNRTLQGKVTGKILGTGDFSDFTVGVGGGGEVSGRSSVNANGTFEVEVRGNGPSGFDLFVSREMRNTTPRAFGWIHNVAVGQDVTVPFLEPSTRFTVVPTGTLNYDRFLSVGRVDYFTGQERMMGFAGKFGDASLLGLDVPSATFMMGAQRRVSAFFGDVYAPLGTSETSEDTPLSVDSKVVDLMAPTTVSSPTLSDKASGSNATNLAGLTIRWQAPREAQVTRVELQTSSGKPSHTWICDVPAQQGSLTPFQASAAVTPAPPKGRRWRILVQSYQWSDYADLTDRFAVPIVPTSRRERRTAAAGWVTLN
jgi:hypothetical protein